jgi:hypothetical protein
MTRERWQHILFDELGYGRLVQQPAIVIDGKSFPVFSQWQHAPIHLVGCGVKIDARTRGVKGAAGQSPHSLLQELLNRSSDRLWGVVSNGLVLRLLRNNVSLTRQAYLEFDLEAMFTGEIYPDFVLLWLVCHQSRVESERPQDCWLERWSRTAVEDGTRALDALRQGVQEAIEMLGAGFLAHPANHTLHRDLREGRLESADYYRALLRLVYRLLFLFVAEDRGVLLDPAGDAVARDRYVTHYSMRRLRTLAARRRGGRQHDRYEQLKFVMSALDSDGCPALALPPLGSFLWSPAAVGVLADAQLANDDLLDAIRSLATIDTGGVRRAVDFRNLGAEELGSIYESLLELHPSLDRDTATFALDVAAGSERKTTGSYYTPTSLISSLLESALEPVIEEAARADDPEAAILSIAVVDPACGSGHFLIAAANRIAKRLASIRSEDPEPAPDEIRAALRDVVGSCIHGVDVNPMAVELCKVSLWMEAIEPGRPLSFLDHRIVLGNSLLGTTPELIAAGVPADAFKPILGDDKQTVAALRKRNAKELAGQLVLDVAGAAADADARALAEKAKGIAAVDDRSLDGVREQQRRFEQLLESPELERARLAADVWCAAFVASKGPGADAVTQDVLARALSAGAAGLSATERGVVEQAREAYALMHWHVAFPDVWERGGFDVVLGNPPWERVKLQEKEFFAARSPDIASAPNKAVRDRLIRALADDNPALLAAFEAAKREAEGASHLIRASGRYPLCGRGDVNTYAVFAELMRSAVGPTGRAGVIVPTGIATDDTTKLFFQEITGAQSLANLYDFENRAGLFPAIDSRMKFCLLTLAGPSRRVESGATFVFFAHRVEDLDDQERRFTLTAEEIALLNPNTRTCPVFRTRRDAELTKAIYRRLGVLINESQPNSWDVDYLLKMVDPTIHREMLVTYRDGAFRKLSGEEVQPGALRPAYEGKQIHQFDHRYASFTAVPSHPDEPEAIALTDAEKQDFTRTVEPRYWIREADFRARIEDRSIALPGFLSTRDITNVTNERTVIACVRPLVPALNSIGTVFATSATDAAILCACLNSFAADYVARQKLGGTHLSPFYLFQLPIPEPAALRDDSIVCRVLELTYTAADLAPFASDLGYDGPPFAWNPERRAVIRAELDAVMFRLYGVGRDDVDYILDTFPIVRRKDEERFGEYRTKRLILDRYDAIIAADAAGRDYETPLNPPPGDPGAAGRAAAGTVPEATVSRGVRT